MAQGAGYNIVSPFGPTGSFGTLVVTNGLTVSGGLNVDSATVGSLVVVTVTNTTQVNATTVIANTVESVTSMLTATLTATGRATLNSVNTVNATVTSSLNAAALVSANVTVTSALTAAAMNATNATVTSTLSAAALLSNSITVTGTLFANSLNANGGSLAGFRDSVVPTTAATVTLAATDSGTIFTNDTAGAQVSFLLPSSPSFGTNYGFVNTSPTQNIKVVIGGTDRFNGAGVSNKQTMTSDTQFETLRIVYVNTNVWFIAQNDGFAAT